jgi:hypothetical protein
MTALATIKNWFLTGLKPTQSQFHAWMDSFWHKDEAIPTNKITGLELILNAKAEKSQFDSHVIDPNAHANLQRISEKGQANGYAPLNEFSQILIGYLKSVNDLVTGGTEAVLTAEQGKILQNQINGINGLLASDNVNLDTVQEIIDAIETVQTSLSTILVNDLTTGGTTKALTAEMGKLLNQNKAEKGSYDGSLSDLKAELNAEGTARNLADVALNALITNLDNELDFFQLINNQIYVDSSGLVQDAWHGKLVTFSANTTQTIPAAGLRVGFNFEGIVDEAASVTMGITAPKVFIGAYIGAVIPQNSIFTFIQRSNDSNKISIFGL